MTGDWWERVVMSVLLLAAVVVLALAVAITVEYVWGVR